MVKIKCPFNCGEYESTPDPKTNACHSDLERHMKDNHDPGMMLVSLLRKIHEKIAEYKGKMVSDLDVSVSIEHLLKSLLEDEKK